MALGAALFHTDKMAAVTRARAPNYFCVFRSYKQQSSDNRVALEMEAVAIFQSPRSNSRPCVRFHLKSRVSFRQRDCPNG